jgi:hypothetical protein
LAAAVRTDETAPAADSGSVVRSAKPTTAPAPAGDDQWCVVRPNHKRTPAATTASVETGTTTALTSPDPANGDLQNLARDEIKITADLGAAAAGANGTAPGAAAALRAKGEDPIGIGRRHREVDEAPGVREVEQGGVSDRPRCGEPHKCYPGQQKPSHFPPLP